MKIYTIQNWRKKLKIALFLLVTLVIFLTVFSLFFGNDATETITTPDVEQLQQDVLTQPLRVQALPDTTAGDIPS